MLHYFKLMRGKNSMKINKKSVNGRRVSRARQKLPEAPPQSLKVPNPKTPKSETIIPGNKEQLQNIMEDSSSVVNSDSELKSSTPTPPKVMSSQRKSVLEKKEKLTRSKPSAKAKSSQNNEGKLEAGAEKKLKSKPAETQTRGNKSKNKGKDSSSLALLEGSSQEEEENSSSSSPEKTWEDTLVVDPPVKEINDEPKFEVKFNTELTKDSYACPSCSKEFSTKKKVIRHYKIHTEERRYRCTRCELRFMTITDYKAHTNTLAHGNKKGFKCSNCPKGFTTKYLLKQHQNAHNGLFYRCQGCPKYYVYKRDLVRHVQSEHPKLDPKETNYDPDEIRQQGGNLVGKAQGSAKKLKGKVGKTKKGGNSSNSPTQILVDDQQIKIEKLSPESGIRENSQQTGNQQNSLQIENNQNSQQTETKKKPRKSKSGTKIETDCSQKGNPSGGKKISNNKKKRLYEETGLSENPLEDEKDTESKSSFQLKSSKRRKMTDSKNSRNEISNNVGNQDGENPQPSGDDDALGDFITKKAKASGGSSNKIKEEIVEDEEEEKERIQECPLCEKVLKSLVKLRKHLKKKHEIIRVIE